MDRFVWRHWHQPMFGQGKDGSFSEWLNREAPEGYRLVQVINHPAYSGRPEMGTGRECIFERVPA